ncbi:exopolysaccharide biosynthesis polyprenyl glycosylphosphotransferase [Sungkyunkwania multivorans]|uniref:Exopolysaccharide biosynthesis polyprenyl glycosylphosphotransferase n=1 Tax=Sungkyunkwania multivorans TaxID=1173618 RepID=A0ABW3CZ61_9FLAO
MQHRRGRYSWLIRPILILLDLAVINLSAYLLFDFQDKTLTFHVYSSLCWFVVSYFIGFYEVYRFTTYLKILSLLIKQALFFAIIFYAFLGFFRITISFNTQAKFLFSFFVAVSAIKLLSYYALKKYREYLGGNKRNVIIIGGTKSALSLASFFTSRSDLGYRLLGIFSNKEKNGIKGNVDESFVFLGKNYVDEIYCSLEELSDTQINKFVRLADQNFYTLKFVPNEQKLFSQRLATQYYGYLPVLSVRDAVLDNSINKIVKRIFDVCFSLLIIIFILSWMIPLMFVIIKLESKGPLFYKHVRNGINYSEFTCYKFRSMKYENYNDLEQVQKEDSRVTKVGRFIRRTSIDELPQFINVFLGDMSVVGPRPHMVSYTKEYAKQIDKYTFLLRHTVKPGVTGLAQIKGFRGEVTSKEDIINRIKYDNFYIENWSLFLDLKIILQTTANIFKGQEKAY